MPLHATVSEKGMQYGKLSTGVWIICFQTEKKFQISYQCSPLVRSMSAWKFCNIKVSGWVSHRN